MLLLWLEKNVRKKYLENTVVDTYVAVPCKDLYCSIRKQS